MAFLSYRRHRFPPPIIHHAIWLYLRFTLSYRVEELLTERDLDLSYETMRRWVLKFGSVIARQLRRRRRRPSDRWHLDEMAVRIAGKRMYLWRAVDQEGEVLDMLVQRRRDSRAVLRLMRKLLKKQGFAPKIAGDRQAALVRLRVPAIGAELPSRTRAQNEQSGGELASSGATTRAQAPTLQISPIRSMLSEHARCRPHHLPPPSPSCLAIDIADLQSRGGSAMGRRLCSSVRSDQPLRPL